MNHHARTASQRFALDLVNVTAFGGRARRFVPRALSDFRAFGSPIVSPVDGTVVAANDGIDDGEPFGVATGNTVTIEPHEHRGYRVVIAHLRKGTVAVETGQAVRTGMLLGEVGSSGNSTEPHLHVHVEAGDGSGVPMLIGRRRPLHRNDLLRRNGRAAEAE